MLCTSSYGASYQANKFLRIIISRQKFLRSIIPFKQRRCTKLKQPSPSRLEARAARDSSDSYAALPSSYAIVRMCALRFRRIKSLSWSLGRRLPIGAIQERVKKPAPKWRALSYLTRTPRFVRAMGRACSARSCGHARPIARTNRRVLVR